ADAGFALHHGDEASAVEALRQAMRLGREKRFASHAWWPASVMSRLCVAALKAGVETDYVRDVIRTRGLTPETPALDVEQWPWAVRVFTLGRFEVLTNDMPVKFAGKAQHKPLALLK